MLRRARQLQRSALRPSVFSEVVENWKRPIGFEVGVEVCGVGTEHHPAALREHPDDLHAARMTADLVYGNARGDLAITVMKVRAALVHLVNHGGDGADVEHSADRGIQHAAT